MTRQEELAAARAALHDLMTGKRVVNGGNGTERRTASGVYGHFRVST